MSSLRVLRTPLDDGRSAGSGTDDTALSGGRSTPVGHLHRRYASDPTLFAEDRVWVRELWDALRPVGHPAPDRAYVNELVEIDEDVLRGSYGSPKYDRLAAIKGRLRPGKPLPPQHQHQAELTRPAADGWAAPARWERRVSGSAGSARPP